MKDPLIELIENDAMFRRSFLEYDAQVPFWSNLVYHLRLFFRI
jgi:hypothetical protein